MILLQNQNTNQNTVVQLFLKRSNPIVSLGKINLQTVSIGPALCLDRLEYGFVKSIYFAKFDVVFFHFIEMYWLSKDDL